MSPRKTTVEAVFIEWSLLIIDYGLVFKLSSHSVFSIKLSNWNLMKNTHHFDSIEKCLHWFFFMDIYLYLWTNASKKADIFYFCLSELSFPSLMCWSTEITPQKCYCPVFCELYFTQSDDRKMYDHNGLWTKQATIPDHLLQLWFLPRASAYHCPVKQSGNRTKTQSKWWRQWSGQVVSLSCVVEELVHFEGLSSV